MAAFQPLQGLFPSCGRTHPFASISLPLTIHKFDSANSVTSWTVFFFKPRKRTFTNPNWRLITRNGCSILARIPALIFSALSIKASAALSLFKALRCQVSWPHTKLHWLSHPVAFECLGIPHRRTQLTFDHATNCYPRPRLRRCLMCREPCAPDQTQRKRQCALSYRSTSAAPSCMNACRGRACAVCYLSMRARQLRWHPPRWLV